MFGHKSWSEWKTVPNRKYHSVNCVCHEGHAGSFVDDQRAMRVKIVYSSRGDLFKLVDCQYSQVSVDINGMDIFIKRAKGDPVLSAMRLPQLAGDPV